MALSEHSDVNREDEQRWHWTMTGTAPMKGTIEREATESGEVVAESAGEAVEQVVNHGWWDSFDQDKPLTITVEPADA